MHKILCATDLSEAADEALRQADGFCQEQGTELTVMHVEPPLVPMGFGGYGVATLLPEEVEANRARIREGLDLQIQRAGVTCRDLRREIVPAGGPVYAEIVRRAEEGKFNLVVVGGHGASGLTRVLLGSVADKVVRYAHAPVLVARKSPPKGEVIVGSDLSVASKTALLAAAREATRRKAPLTAIHCLGYPPELMGFGYAPLVPAPPGMPQSRVAQERATKERLEGELREVGVQAKVVVDEGEAPAGIVRLAETLPAQLVVIGASGKTGLARVFLGSTAMAMVHRAPCSVLVARPLG